MILIDKILMIIVLVMTGTLLILLIKFAKDNPKELLWAIRRRDFYNILDFAVKLQPDENTALLSRRKKKKD